MACDKLYIKKQLINCQKKGFIQIYLDIVRLCLLTVRMSEIDTASQNLLFGCYVYTVFTVTQVLKYFFCLENFQE